MRHERGGGTGLLPTGRSPGSSPCCRRRHSLRRAADPSSRDTVAPAVYNALLHLLLRRRSRPRLVALCWLHRRGFTSLRSLLRCCRGSVPAPHAPRPRRAFGTILSTHVPAPGCVPFRACAASPGWSFVDALEEERPGCCSQLPIGHSEPLQRHRAVVVFLQGLLPQQMPLLFLYLTGLCCGSKSFLARSLRAGVYSAFAPSPSALLCATMTAR